MWHRRNLVLVAATAAAVLLSTASAFASDGHHHGDAKPMHGGVVVEVKHVDYELVAKPDVVELHLRNHGKPVDVSEWRSYVDGGRRAIQLYDVKPD